MREVAQADAGTRRTYTVHVRPNETCWSFSVYGLNGGRAEVAVLDEVEHVARTLIALALDVPNDAFDVVVRVLADAGAYWLHPDALGSDRRPGVPGVR
jgi:hypothetical protein